MTQALSLFSESSLESSLAKCEVLIKSGLISAKSFPTPESVLIACTFGAELGFSSIQSLQSIYVIEGKPTLSANALQAIVIKNGGEINILEHTDKLCTVEVLRAGRVHPYKYTYTIADAAQANLLGKSNWVKMPKNMLMARATSAAIRFVFADILAGLYSTEEIEDSSNFAQEEGPKSSKKASRTVAEPAVAVEPVKPALTPAPVVEQKQAGVVEYAPDALPVVEGTPIDFSNKEHTDELVKLYTNEKKTPVKNVDNFVAFLKGRGLTTFEGYKTWLYSGATRE